MKIWQRLQTKLGKLRAKVLIYLQNRLSGYVAAGFLLPRNGVRTAFRFHPFIRGRVAPRRITPRRIVDRARYHDFGGLVLWDTCFLLLGLHL